MEPMITSFGISLAAGIVIEVFKSCFPPKVDKQIEDAFEEALNKCVKNDEFTKRTYKLEIKRKIRDNYSHNPNANLRDETVTGLHSKFFIEFEIALIKKEPAYAYIKEVRDDSRFQELKYGQEDLKQGVNEIKEQLANFISQSNKSDSLKSEYLRQLSQYQTNLEELNPTVALNNIIALEESFDKNSFTPEDSFKSKIELLKAKCYSLINGKKDETLECYIKAYNLNKSSNEAKELAAYAYYEKENVQKTDSLIKEILLIDDDNPIAWALQIVLADSDSLSELLVETPSYIINNNIFKRFLFICSIKCNKFKDLDKAFEAHNILLDISHYDNTKLTYHNYKERLFLVESIIQRYGKNLEINFIKVEHDKERIKALHQILDNFIIGVQKSELDNYKIVNFFHAYFDYLITENKDSVYLMKDIYKDIENKNEFHLLLIANALQIEKDFDGAINMIGESKQKSELLLYLEMFCFQQKKDVEGYAISTKQYLGTIKRISIFDSERIFLIIETLYEKQKLFEFDADEFIQNKEFELNAIKTLLREYITILTKKPITNTIENLIKVKPSILKQENERIKYRLANLFYIINEYEEAFKILDDIVDRTKDVTGK